MGDGDGAAPPSTAMLRGMMAAMAAGPAQLHRHVHPLGNPSPFSETSHISIHAKGLLGNSGNGPKKNPTQLSTCLPSQGGGHNPTEQHWAMPRPQTQRSPEVPWGQPGPKRGPGTPIETPMGSP